MGPPDGKRGWLSRGPNLGDGSPTVLLTGLAPLCCADEVRGLLSQVLQLVEVSDSSPSLMTTGLALPPAPGFDEQGEERRRATLSHPCYPVTDG